MKRNIVKLFSLMLLLAVMAAGAAFGAEKSGVVTEDGVTRVYTAGGRLIKNKPAYKVKVDGGEQFYAISKKGVAKRLEGVEELAARQLCLLKAGGKKSTANLKKAFLWSAGLQYRNNTNNMTGKAAAEYYGQYGFENGAGDCNSMAYTFYWMAKVLGYSAKGVQGYVPDGIITNLRSHAWVTIKFGGKTYVFDPNFNQTYRGRFGTYCGFKITYGQKNTYRYFSKARKELG